MINAKVSDFTESLDVNFVRENGEAIMGMTAEIYREKSMNWNQDET